MQCCFDPSHVDGFALLVFVLALTYLSFTGEWNQHSIVGVDILVSQKIGVNVTSICCHCC